MKVLWVSNLSTPEISIALGRVPSNGGGWLVGLMNVLRKSPELQIAVCFPDNETKEILSGRTNGIEWYALPFPKPRGYQPITYVVNPTRQVEAHMRSILRSWAPDILHIFGTEIVHSFVAAEVFGNPQRTLVHLQGVLTYCLKHYFAGVPPQVVRGMGIAEVFRGTIRAQWRKMRGRSEYERKMLGIIGNVAGRTDWDHAVATRLCPRATYFRYGEILRDAFYRRAWSLPTCERHSIFFSAATTPLKGLHHMLEAMPDVLRQFPDAKLYVAGTAPETLRIGGLMVAPVRRSYLRYVEALMRKLQLTHKVFFTGPLGEEEMCDRYLKSHAFVCASSIENSSNSIGEAMLLGVPTVASYVGGTSSILDHGREGFLYPADAPYMLAHYVCRVFADDGLAGHLSEAARARASTDHDREQNGRKVLEIYQQMSRSG
jgi:glycosyltransferase involved in cell wall biosynthesis